MHVQHTLMPDRAVGVSDSYNRPHTHCLTFGEHEPYTIISAVESTTLVLHAAGPCMWQDRLRDYRHCESCLFWLSSISCICT